MKKFNISKKSKVIAIVIVLLIAVLTILLFLKPNVDYSTGIINDIKFEITPSPEEDYGWPYIEITNNSKNELTKFVLEYEPKSSLSNKLLRHLIYYIVMDEKHFPINKNFNRSRIKMIGGFDAKDSVYGFVRDRERIYPKNTGKRKYLLYFEVYDENLEDQIVFCDPDLGYDCTEWLTDYEFFDYFELKKAYLSFKNDDYIDNYVFDYKTKVTKKISSERYISEIDYILKYLLSPFKSYEIKQKKEEDNEYLEYEFKVLNVKPEDVLDLVESVDISGFQALGYPKDDMWETSDTSGNNNILFFYYEKDQVLEINLTHKKTYGDYSF